VNNSKTLASKRKSFQAVAVIMAFCMIFSAFSVLTPIEAYADTDISITLNGAEDGDCINLWGLDSDGEWQYLDSGDADSSGTVSFSGAYEDDYYEAYTVFTLYFCGNDDYPEQWLGGYFNYYDIYDGVVDTFYVAVDGSYSDTLDLYKYKHSIIVTLNGAEEFDEATLYGKNSYGDWEWVTYGYINDESKVTFQGSFYDDEEGEPYTEFTIRYYNEGNGSEYPSQFIGGIIGWNYDKATSFTVQEYVTYTNTFTLVSPPKTTINLTLTGAKAGDGARLYGKLIDEDGEEYWRKLDYEEINASGFVTFSDAYIDWDDTGEAYTEFTVRYLNYTDEVYPSQFIGGAFSSNPYSAESFAVTPGATVSKTYALVKPTLMTLKVTPKKGDPKDPVFPFNRIGVSVLEFSKSPLTGAPRLIGIIDTEEWDDDYYDDDDYDLYSYGGDSGDYNLNNLFIFDNATGIYSFVVEPGKTYLFSARGVVYNSEDEYENDNPSHIYSTTYLGGYMGILTGNPANVTQVTAPSAGQIKDAGTITLGNQGTGIITGTTVDDDSWVCARNPVTGEDYDSVWNRSTKTYSIKGLPTGLYAVTCSDPTGESVRFVEVENGKTTTLNFGATSWWIDFESIGDINTNILGKPVAGSTITASSTVKNIRYQAVPPTFSYIWTDGIRILSDKPSYLIANDLVGKDLHVITLITSYGFTSWFTQTADGKVIAKSDPPPKQDDKVKGKATFTLKVTGTYKVGKKLKATLSKPAVKGQKYTYQWLRNGKAIKGNAAKKATYKLVKADKGKKISVKVSSKASGWTSVSKTSKAKKVK